MFIFTWDGFLIAMAIMMHAIIINRGTTKLWPFEESKAKAEWLERHNG